MRLIYSVRPDGSAFIVLEVMFNCGCGKAAAFVVNRNGKTRCLECDNKIKETQNGDSDSRR